MNGEIFCMMMVAFIYSVMTVGTVWMLRDALGHHKKEEDGP